MDPKPRIRVVAAVIVQEGRCLLGQRPMSKRHGGLWEFPGGKLEPGETIETAARRELQEELGVDLDACGPCLFTIGDGHSDFVIEFHPVAIQGEPRCLEHAALRWVARQDLLALELAPSDRLFVESLAGAPGQSGFWS